MARLRLNSQSAYGTITVPKHIASRPALGVWSRADVWQIELSGGGWPEKLVHRRSGNPVDVRHLCLQNGRRHQTYSAESRLVLFKMRPEEIDQGFEPWVLAATVPPIMDKPVILHLHEEGLVEAGKPCSMDWRGVKELKLKRRTDKRFIGRLDRCVEARLIMCSGILCPDFVPEETYVTLAKPLYGLELNTDRDFHHWRASEFRQIGRSLGHSLPIVRANPLSTSAPDPQANPPAPPRDARLNVGGDPFRAWSIKYKSQGWSISGGGGE